METTTFAAPTAAAKPAAIASAEADAWAEARAADTADAYKVYLAAYPEGAFRAAAVERLAEAKPAPKAAAAAAPAPRPRPVQTASAAPSRASIAASCRRYVDEKLSQPSRVGRTVGGAAVGCGVGALAGGDDGRNCVVGAVVGGATGAISAESRERRRMQEVQYCIANGGPPRG
jgi:uncharacterized protein YcfJ